MAVIIGVTGAHGTGKTTALKKLADMNAPNVVIDDFSVPRSVQAMYDKPLAEIIADPANVPEFQERVRQIKAYRVIALRKEYPDDRIRVFTDRSPVDFYAYTRTWVEKHRLSSAWLHQYQMECAKDLLHYDSILVMPPRNFFFVAEANRADEATQKLNHEYCMSFVRSYCKSVYVIRSKTVANRALDMLTLTQSLVI